MNKPKKKKRAASTLNTTSITRPAFLSYPVADHVAAYIGLVVTEYVRLEQKMISVFRVVLGIESGEAAFLAYNAISSPSARWKVARKVLENDQGHVTTPSSYDDLIDRFIDLTDFRNVCAHHIWEMDEHNQLWKTKTDKPLDAMQPDNFEKAKFDDALQKMHELYEDITEVVRVDRTNLDRRWMQRRQEVADAPAMR